MTFYQKLFKHYMNVDFPKQIEEVSKFDKHINWYYAEANNMFINAEYRADSNLVEIDIKSAFPTICFALYGDCNFTREINKIQDKKDKNIFIATTLKSENVLSDFNKICKMVIMGICFSNINKSSLLFEIKKDSCLLLCDDESMYNLLSLDQQDNDFTRFILNNNFKFHISKYISYIRTNKTSTFLDKNGEVHLKGTYKYIPDYLRVKLKEVLTEKNTQFDEITDIYNKQTLKIIRNNGLMTLFEKFYLCDKKRILDNDGVYTRPTPNTIIDPHLYLKLFLYPSILSIKMNSL